MIFSKMMFKKTPSQILTAAFTKADE